MQTSHTQSGQVTGSDLAVAMSAGTSVAPLSQPELDELTACEKIIRRGLDTFIEVGIALQKIRDGQLYRQGYDTFEDYCRERWQMTSRRARQIMSGMRVVENLTEGTSVQPPSVQPPETRILPTNERQTRPLMGLAPGEQKEIWEKAKALAGEGNVPTGTQVIAAKMSSTEANEERPELPERVSEALRYLRGAGQLGLDISIHTIFNCQKAGWGFKECGEIFDEMVDRDLIVNRRLVSGEGQPTSKAAQSDDELIDEALGKWSPKSAAAQPAKAGTPSGDTPTITLKRKGEVLDLFRWTIRQIQLLKGDAKELGKFSGQAIYHLDHAAQMVECAREQFVRAEAREVEQEKTEGTETRKKTGQDQAKAKKFLICRPAGDGRSTQKRYWSGPNSWTIHPEKAKALSEAAAKARLAKTAKWDSCRRDKVVPKP